MAEGKMSIQAWTVFIIMGVVLLAIVAGTYNSLYHQASTFKNSTGNSSLATVLVTLLPILLAAGVLLVFVGGFIGKWHRG